MLLKDVIRNAFLGIAYSFSESKFKEVLIKGNLNEGQLVMMRNLMNKQSKKINEFIKIIDLEIELIKNKKNE